MKKTSTTAAAINKNVHKKLTIGLDFGGIGRADTACSMKQVK